MHTRTAPHLCHRHRRTSGARRTYPQGHRLAGHPRHTLAVRAAGTLARVGVVRATGLAWPARPWAARAVAGGTSYHRTLRQAVRAVVAAAPCPYYNGATTMCACTPAQHEHMRQVAAVPHNGHDLPATLCLATAMTHGWPCPACQASPVWQAHTALHEHAARVGMAHHDRQATHPAGGRQAARAALWASGYYA